MFDFFRSSREKAIRPDRQPANAPNSVSAASGPSSSPQQTATHRELVRVVLRDTLRLNGIPADWISGEVLARAQTDQAGAQQIQLVIHHWHEGLLRYAPMLQQHLLQGLQRFDPVANHAGHQVVWKFAPELGYPLDAFPPAAYWTQPAAADQQKFDLPPSTRDFRGSDDFAPTEPSPLR